MNDEVGRAKSISITSDVGVGGGREWGNILHKLNMMGHKDFFESGVKTEEGTLNKGVVEKDTRTRFEVKFARKVGTQPRKT